MTNINKLTLEQEFKIALYINKINSLDKNSTKKYLTDVLKKMMIKDNIIRYCIKNTSN
uniref:Phycobilisome degradation protein n=1 Tax=Symphyocladia marchantioides TaxID=88360 RepID=UPI0022FD522E|nr:Phycobilisome degradation protein [Symphyocladia marchantioides]WAX03835.1 Phycobilisome degradation protein [Symphyocladia marchantioides]